MLDPQIDKVWLGLLVVITGRPDSLIRLPLEKSAICPDCRLTGRGDAHHPLVMLAKSRAKRLDVYSPITDNQYPSGRAPSVPSTPTSDGDFGGPATEWTSDFALHHCTPPHLTHRSPRKTLTTCKPCCHIFRYTDAPVPTIRRAFSPTFPRPSPRIQQEIKSALSAGA